MVDMEQTTQQRILQAAQEEFLRLGFQNSSLRSIAKACGVTTGALYGYYSDKDALFDALVREAAETLYDIYLRAHQEFEALPPEQQLAEMTQQIEPRVWECFDYIYEHYDAFKLLICHAEGTSYENYVHRMAEVEVQSSYIFLSRMENMGRQVPHIPDDLNHMLASAYLTGFFEVVAHDMPKEEAREYIGRLTDFFSAGWKNLLGLV
ncbi:TetR/AcrR family transcriptional regulator [Desulfitobacterium chlororespirans]|uniref:Transcriptional regulator, TetR family n=1 Tax=Desulfitobacterium chlororespirans DSM 11544 TaxID=1121395 RepID=A0A1M7UBF6_9FIRM|nr:TetR/AcrR family transcriptional regulator [Desulfitobacterium chlororespirans]SHN80323.1 transcriptional regulator, TetR family [Desulfitobacterium chlororespirans DSM 11544]